MRIYVIDDDAVFCESVVEEINSLLLNDYDDVVPYSDNICLETMLNDIRSNDVALILLDVVVHDFDNEKFYNELFPNNRDKVVLISTFEIDMKKLANKLNMKKNKIIKKPIDKETIAQILNQFNIAIKG